VKHKNRENTCEYWREDCRRRRPWLFLHHQLLHLHDEDGLVHALNYGFFGVTCIVSLCVLHYLEPHELPLHDCCHNFITTMVVFLLLRWLMRYKFYYVFDVLIYKYFILFKYDLLWSNLYARTQESDVCVRWINLAVAWIMITNPYAAKVFHFPLTTLLEINECLWYYSSCDKKRQPCLLKVV
jgi:hypothetical protein